MSETTEQRLTREGWTKQSTHDEPRLSEMVETYQELGFEVRLEPLRPEQTAECTECMKGSAEQFKVIYTRRPA